MLNKDFKEFIELLNSRRVEYLIVGGYALAAHGHPRYTGDIDSGSARVKTIFASCLTLCKRSDLAASASPPKTFPKSRP